MIKREEIANPQSCLNRALDDEMTFVLLARDPTAARVIRFWVNERINLGKNNEGDREIKEALECASRMQRSHDEVRRAVVEMRLAVKE